MGLDLALAPIRHHGMDWWLAFDRLAVDRDGLGHMIADLDDDLFVPLPKTIKFEWYDDEGSKRKTTDSYGAPLAYMLAGNLSKHMVKYATKEKVSPWNEAVISFISSLPVDTPVVLWWHMRQPWE